VLLVQPVSGAPHLHSPELLRISRKPDLRKRNAKLGCPSEGVDVACSLPDRIVRSVPILVIAFHAEWVELEPVAAVLVAERVEDKSDLVGSEISDGQKLVSSCQYRADSLRALGIVHP